MDKQKTLDIGCGPHPRGEDGCDAYGIDVGIPPPAHSPRCAYGWDVSWQTLPYEDNAFVKVFAHDLLEHIPKVIYRSDRRDGPNDGVGRPHYAHIHLFNEIYRVLRPGGIFESCTPAYPHMEALIGDPTHCSLWSVSSFNYLAPAGPENFEFNIMKNYGYKALWRKVDMRWVHGTHLMVQLMAVKPAEPSA